MTSRAPTPPTPTPAPAWTSVAACLEAPRCAASELERLISETEDDDCWRLLDTVHDDKRGRSCLERTVTANESHDASSCDAGQAELAMMRIDGRGGPVDIAGARALFARCYDDVTKSAVLEHAAKKEKNPKAPSVDFCREMGGTTLTNQICLARRAEAERMRTYVTEKNVAKELDDAALPFLVEARKAMLAFAAADSDLVYQQFIDGTLRGSMAMIRSDAVLKDWQIELGKLAETRPPKAPAGSVETRIGVMLLEPEVHEEVKTALGASQKAWITYRDAHLALVFHTYGLDARAAAEARLTATRIGHLDGDDAH